MVENIGDKIENTISDFANLLSFDRPRPSEEPQWPRRTSNDDFELDLSGNNN